MSEAVRPQELILYCPGCSKQHVDLGEWATKPHLTHLCVNDERGPGCGLRWSVEPFVVGVLSLGAAEADAEAVKPESPFLFASRTIAQSDRVVAGAISRIEADVLLLKNVAQDPSCSSERQLAAGLGIAVVQHLIDRTSKDATTAAIADVQRALKR